MKRRIIELGLVGRVKHTCEPLATSKGPRAKEGHRTLTVGSGSTYGSPCRMMQKVRGGDGRSEGCTKHTPSLGGKSLGVIIRLLRDIVSLGIVKNAGGVRSIRHVGSACG